MTLLLRACASALLALVLIAGFADSADAAKSSRRTRRAQAASRIAKARAASLDSLLRARADSLERARADSVAAALAVPPPPPPRDYVAEARDGFTARNRAYNSTRITLRWVELLWALAVPLLLLFTGLSARFRDIAHALGQRPYVRVLVYFIFYVMITGLLNFPLTWYREFALEHQYGLSNQTLSDWLIDGLKSAVLTIVLVGVVPSLSLAYSVIERSPRGWWLWFAAGTVPVALALTLLQPLVFDPLFNKFTPLRDTALQHDIVALAQKAGIPGRHVYEVDMSTKTKKYNAYVSGFGASQRIVLWDTTLQGMKRDEILFVMGHEMGHYRLGHIWKSVIALGIMALIGFALMAWIVHAALRRFGARWEVRSAHDVAGMPVLAGALTIVLFVLSPFGNAIGRRIEHEADVFGLEVTRDNDAAARAFLQLGSQNLSDPEPPRWVEVMFLDHPPLADRIRFAMEYRPWERGVPNRAYRP